jgi:para-aminobenzoate synthetase/4-amino-4-deoxychorismate lyase
MTSTVIGRLRDNVGYGDLMRGLFPCGSVTGAPKIRAMEIIRQLEIAPRGVYCGAIGYFGPDRAALSVAIRTAVLQPEKTGDAGERWAGRMGIGSGVVWDSDPAAEYDECLLKGRFLSDLEHGQSSPEGDLELIETMRAEAGTVSLLDRHAARLADSAAYFGFAFEADAFRQRVHEAARALDGNGPHKLRATLDRYGRITVEATPLDPPADGPWRLTVAPTRVDADNPYRYHKTTRRDVYDEALAYAQEHGCDEALLRNGDGVVTEGSYTNVFAKIDGTLYTPPVDEGVLGGVYRAYVLDTRDDAAERTLTPDDLRAADALYVCNAVRGWNEAVLMEAETTPADTSAEKAHPVRAQP